MFTSATGPTSPLCRAVPCRAVPHSAAPRAWETPAASTFGHA